MDYCKTARSDEASCSGVAAILPIKDKSLERSRLDCVSRPHGNKIKD